MAVHTFASAEDAAAVSVDVEVKDGDVLVVPSEQIVAVACCRTFAVTANERRMNYFTVDWLIEKPKALLDLVKGIHGAVAEAKHLGYGVRPEFECFSPDATVTEVSMAPNG